MDEIVTLISLALGNPNVPPCPAGDLDGDGNITVDEIVRAIDATLNGCLPVLPSPTATPLPTASATPTRTPEGPGPVLVSFDFRNGAAGWEAGFADYPLANEVEFDLLAELAPIPPETGSSGTAFRISGNNRSDDLFMYLKVRLGRTDGLRPDTEYDLTFTLRFASNAPSGCVGIGGAPGESVFLKAGASGDEPLTLVDDDGWVRMTVDKGNQAQEGPAGANAGDIANGVPCDEVDPANPPFVSRQVVFTSPYRGVADSAGDLWILVGTDSGFEGRTTLYYQRIAINLTPSGRDR